MRGIILKRPDQPEIRSFTSEHFKAYLGTRLLLEPLKCGPLGPEQLSLDREALAELIGLLTKVQQELGSSVASQN